MNKKLLMLLFAGFSFVMLPACGDDEDETTNEQTGGEQTSTGLQLSEIAGKYSGSLFSALEPGEPIQEGLGVVVSTGANNTLTLKIEPIEILGIQVDNIAFDGIPASYDSAKDAWNFTASGLKVALMEGLINAEVDVKQGAFTKGALDFTINVKTDQGVDIDLIYTGKK